MKTSITIIVLFLTITGQAQEKLNFGNYAFIDLPPNAVKYEDVELKNKLTRDPFTRSVATYLTANLYRIGNIKLRLSSSTNIAASDYIGARKQSIDANKRSHKEYNSSRKTVNGNDVLITFTSSGSKLGYVFFVYNRSRNKSVVTGFLEANSSEKDNTLKLVDTMISSVTFK